jgi:2,5-diketo-D-gluconate reductase B
VVAVVRIEGAGEVTLKRIGEKHGGTAVQIAIAWLLDQEGVIAIPKARHKENQQSNLDAPQI